MMPMFRKILVAYDHTDAGHRALSVGLQLASVLHAELVICGVSRTSLGSIDAGTFDRSEPPKEVFDRAFKELRADAIAMSVSVRTEFCTAVIPLDAVTERLERERPDLVVVGRPAQGRLMRWVNGSLADEILGRSSYPVLVVPEGYGKALDG